VLKNATQQVYEDAYQQGLYPYGDFYFGPSVDGHVIRALPSQEFKQGHFAKVPMLVDHNGYEGYLYSNRSETTFEQADAGLRKLLPAATDSFFARLYQLYPQSAYNSTLFLRQQIFGDIFVNCPTVRDTAYPSPQTRLTFQCQYYMSRAVADAGQATYKLIFNAGSQFHSATTPFLFNQSEPGCKSPCRVQLHPESPIATTMAC
jgi:carboxylesterase type B